MTTPRRWQDVLRTEPDHPRQLTLLELRRLHRLGFTALAESLAAGICPDCGLSRTGTGHRQMCVEPAERKRPLTATELVKQPWVPRPSRHSRHAA